MVELSVRAMTQPEFDGWRDSVVRQFATAQAEAGVWRSDEALDRAMQGHLRLLPDGMATDGMLLLMGARPDGVAVGRLWIGLAHPRGTPDCAFLYDIEVDAEHRGAGYGRALLAAAEDVVRSHGIGALELNVFAGNDRAIRLYATSGYAVVTQQMRKDLRAGR